MAEKEPKKIGGVAGKPHPHRGKENADEQIIFCLILGFSQTDAAKHANISVNTVKRRLNCPQFQEKLSEARREIVRRAVDKASYYGMMSMDRLHQLTESANDAIALGAARTLAEICFRVQEDRVIDERIAKIEAALAR